MRKNLLCFAAAVLILFIAGLLYLLRFERVDNLGAYSIPSETGLFPRLRQVTTLLPCGVLTLLQTKDEAYGQPEIALGPHCTGGIKKRRVQIVSLDSNAQWPRDSVFDSASNCIRESYQPAMKVVGFVYWHRSVDEGRTGQRVNKHSGISVLNRIEHWTTKKAQLIATVPGAEDVGCTDIRGIYHRPPARA
jgi:hypothetical protein